MRGGFPDRLDGNLNPTRTHRAHRISFQQRKRVSAITALPPRCLLRRALITLLALLQETTGSLSAHFRRQHTPAVCLCPYSIQTTTCQQRKPCNCLNRIPLSSSRAIASLTLFFDFTRDRRLEEERLEEKGLAIVPCKPVCDAAASLPLASLPLASRLPSALQYPQ